MTSGRAAATTTRAPTRTASSATSRRNAARSGRIEPLWAGVIALSYARRDDGRKPSRGRGRAGPDGSFAAARVSCGPRHGRPLRSKRARRPAGRCVTRSGRVRLHDERTGQLRDLPLRPRMSVYVCGITPYDSAHLGHGFLYAQFDVLVRYLRSTGIEVDHIQNVTDVDDDILRTARERGIDYLELAEREVAAFERDMGAIGIAVPTHVPRATR